MSYRTWTDKDLIRAVETSTTKAEIIRKLGYSSVNSGNYKSIDKHVRRLNIDVSHLRMPDNNAGNFKKKLPLNEILVENSTYASTAHLKNRLIKEQVLEDKCSECGINQWQNKKLTLHLDHKDGNTTNNQLSNLRLLCPNCHSQTTTYCRGQYTTRPKRCTDCGCKISRKSYRCKKCKDKLNRNKHTKIMWPDSNTLQSMVDNSNYLQVSKELGVSDNAIRKRLRKYPPTSGQGQ